MADLEKNFGTAIDELLSEEDLILTDALLEVQRIINKIIREEGFGDILVETIKESPCVNFFSTRSEEEAAAGVLSINLYVDFDKAKETYEIKSSLTNDDDSTIEMLSRIVVDEVCKPLSDKITDLAVPHWKKIKEVFWRLPSDVLEEFANIDVTSKSGRLQILELSQFYGIIVSLTASRPIRKNKRLITLTIKT